MERRDAVAFFGTLLCRKTFYLNAFVDLNTILDGNILAVQFLQPRLHDRLRICPAFRQDAFQCIPLVSVKPQL